jgi:thioredoxin-related protein
MKRFSIYTFVFALLILFGTPHLFGSGTSSQGEKKEANLSKEKENTLTWYKYDEGLAKAQKEKKHVMVHFYTTWCGWCKRMEANTFSNEEIRKVLNESYVAVRVNGQSGEKVKVDGEQMAEKQVAGMYGVRAYPITWFLKPSGERIAPRRGYVGPDEFLYILNWVKDDLYEKITFQEFVEQEQRKQKTNQQESR